MRRAALLGSILAVACAHETESEMVAPEPQPEPAATVQFEEVALEVEIFEPHDGSTVARPKLLTPVGEAAEVSAKFTLRPARQHVWMLALEMTPTSVSEDGCEIDVRSQVIDDPRLLITGPPQPKTIPVGEWVEVVTTEMVAARVRCKPPGPVLADSPRRRTRI